MYLVVFCQLQVVVKSLTETFLSVYTRKNYWFRDGHITMKLNILCSICHHRQQLREASQCTQLRDCTIIASLRYLSKVETYI